MGRLRGFLWLAAGLVVAVLAGSVIFVTLSRATGTPAQDDDQFGPTQSAVVVRQRVEVGSLLTADDLELKDVSVESLPEDAAREIDQVSGRVTLVDLYPGEIVLQQRLVDPNVVARDGRTAVVISEGKVLMAFPAADLMSQLDILKPGDHVDFLFSYTLPVDRGEDFLSRTEGGVTAAQGEGEAGTELVTFDLLQNVTIADVVGGAEEGGEGQRAPQAILLTVDPQDALVLKYMKDVGATLDLVLRAPGDESEFEVDPVNLDYIINGYIVPGTEEE